MPQIAILPSGQWTIIDNKQKVVVSEITEEQADFLSKIETSESSMCMLAGLLENKAYKPDFNKPAIDRFFREELGYGQ